MALDQKLMESFDPELRRAFDFKDNKVPKKLRDPSKLKPKKGHLKVSGDGVFYTLQGEGTTTGLPAVFLRLHICNLRCTWCDTWYTWNPDTPEFWTESKDWSIKETAKRLEEEWGCEDPKVQKRVVITGGEPLLQQDKIEQLMKLLKDWAVEIETNGTIVPTAYLAKRCQFNCSPKLANSLNEKRSRIRPEAIKALKKLDTTFKFVVTKPEDIDELEKDYVKAFKIDPNKVVVMPQGITSKEVRETGGVVAEHVKKKGYRLLLRLQLDLWGAKRKA